MFKTQNSIYGLSKDYDRLFSVLLNGNDVMGIVDHEMSDRILRDPVRIKRRGEYDIDLGVRGIGYGSVCTFEKGKGTEKHLFIKECKRLNLEWICPI